MKVKIRAYPLSGCSGRHMEPDRKVVCGYAQFNIRNGLILCSLACPLGGFAKNIAFFSFFSYNKDKESEKGEWLWKYGEPMKYRIPD